MQEYISQPGLNVQKLILKKPDPTKNVLPEPKREGHYVLVPELNMRVKIHKGKTLQQWLLKAKENDLISNTLWTKLQKKYF